MPGKNKAPLLGWHPPAELSAWVRGEAARRGVPMSVVLNEAVDALRTRGGVDSESWACTRCSAPHIGRRPEDGVCPDCRALQEAQR